MSLSFKDEFKAYLGVFVAKMVITAISLSIFLLILMTASYFMKV